MTKVVELDGRAAMEREAREWLIRLDGDAALTPSESQALHEWLNRSPQHRAELTRLARFWTSANVLTQLAVPLQRERGAGYRIGRVRGLAVAACAVIASIILIVGWMQMRPGDAANGAYVTAIGQQQTISLPDGSSIQLNTGSEIRVEYSATARQIHMLRGEALFTVAHDSRRPFDVLAAQGRVRAVGTAFAVQLESGRAVRVTVTKGVVEVAEVSRADLRLKAGETMRIGDGSRAGIVQHLTGPELQRRMAWQEGYLAFNGESLSEVVAQVNRYSPVQLQIDDPRLAAISVGGRFRIGDLDAVLDVLRDQFGIQANRIDARTIRLEPLSQS